MAFFTGSTNANAQGQGGASPAISVIPVSLTYSYSYSNSGCDPSGICGSTTITTTFSGSANITPVEGGYGGTGSGVYEDVEDNVVQPYQNCPQGHSSHMAIAGNAGMIVNYQFSIDNDVTGGPDTTMNITGTNTPMYNSSWGVVEVLVEDYDLRTDQTSTICGQTQSNSHDEGAANFGCHFYSLDFTKGGSWTQEIEVTDGSTATCVLTIGESSETLRIFGTATVPASIYGVKGISNSKVVIAEMDDDEIMKSLSTSKPDFFSETLTADNETANYEFRFARNDASELPRILVVSLLWHVGNPEFAVTNGEEVNGSFVPVYQALCVDDKDETRCEKWQRASDGSYEAQVDFEYGNEGKLSQTMSIMEMEAWEGATSTQQLMKDSAYIYYNSYRGVKYLNTLEPQRWDPFMAKAYHVEENCTAYFDAPAKFRSDFPSFGDLGTFLDSVEATGSGIYYCGSESALERPHAPVNREWHELGHYLLYSLYSPYDGRPNTNHAGYANDSTNDSFIEGFAEFTAMATNEYYGDRTPHIYPVGSSRYNLEQDYKVWGPQHHEEFAVAGILWDIHDAGTERGGIFVANNKIFTRASAVMNNTDDTYATDVKSIISIIDRKEPKTLEALLISLNGGSLGPTSASLDVIKIGLNHGAFADINGTRNWFHDSWNAEPVGQTGNAPNRYIRSSPAPELPGSNLVSDKDAVFNVTIKHIEEFSHYDYSYLLDMKADEPTFFSVPPEYYPSIVSVTPLSRDGEPLNGTVDINSTDYWNYIRSNPAEDQVFKSITVGGSASDATTAVQYIQNVKNLLARASTEYKAGNATGAQVLVNIAYLDNFDHVEPLLEQLNATALKEEIEEMMRVELVGLIENSAEQESVDAKIAEIDAKLEEAIVIVPEFTLAAVFILASAIGAFILMARTNSFARNS